VPGADQFILQQLAALGLQPDEPVVWQSGRGADYQQALDQLVTAGLAYPCACSRQDIEMTQAALGHLRERHAGLVYPGTCRNGLHGRPARAWRFNTREVVPEITARPAQQTEETGRSTASHRVSWCDRRLGAQQQDVATEVGDFVLKRADGFWAYQLAVVVDDALQGITDVVRGEDLADNTPRQILLQRALGLPTPRYLHTPLVRGANGEKLSKQNGAQPLDTSEPLAALNAAASVLGLKAQTAPVPQALHHWISEWMDSWATSRADCATAP
jgi:glutamyl-Q tRNA(Asp) synthetase